MTHKLIVGNDDTDELIVLAEGTESEMETLRQQVEALLQPHTPKDSWECPCVQVFFD